jgi:hypothetical protein
VLERERVPVQAAVELREQRVVGMVDELDQMSSSGGRRPRPTRARS